MSVSRQRPTAPGWYAFRPDGCSGWTAVTVMRMKFGRIDYLEFAASKDPKWTIDQWLDSDGRPLPECFEDAVGEWIPIQPEGGAMSERLTITKVGGGWAIEDSSGKRWVATTPAKMAGIVKLWAQAEPTADEPEPEAVA